MGETERKLYIFDLSPLLALGQHRPYYDVIGQVVHGVLGLNTCFRFDYFDDQLKMTIADTCADAVKENQYITTKELLLIEKMCFKILKRIHHHDDNIVTNSQHVVRHNEIYIEVQKWT